MAEMSTTAGYFLLTTNIADSGTQTITLATENTFVDKNIVIKTSTPAAANPTLAITDKSDLVTVGTASSGVYPLTTSLYGKTTYGTAGWIGTGGLAAALDSSVQVGTIAQSTMSLGGTALASGDTINPSVTATQTVTIAAGYEGARTLVINSMSSGLAAAATVTATKQATTPTLANTASSVNGKTLISINPSTGTSDISKYYLAVTANAPATSFAATDATKTVNTVGYLSAASLITVANSAINTSANSQLYYIPLPTAAASVTVSQAAANPTATTSTATITGKTAVAGTPTTSSSSITKYFIPFTVNAPATTITSGNISKSVTTNGYIDNAGQISVTAGTTGSSSTYYMPLASGALAAGAGSTTATSSNVTTSVVNSEPSGYYITIQGSGSASVGTAGYLEAGTSLSSNTATKYVSLNTATVSASGATVTVSEGYVPSAGLTKTISNGTITSGASSKSGYANNTTEVPANGYLYINAGYFPNTQISLASLIPDSTTYTNATSAQMLNGFEAYDTDGNMLIGTITTYTGVYTIS